MGNLRINELRLAKFTVIRTVIKMPSTISDESADVEYSSSSFNIHTFAESICDTDVQFQIIKMDNSIFIWIGCKDSPSFADLSLAMKTVYDNFPLTTKIFGSNVEVESSNIGGKLARKLGKPVYISFNVTADRLLLPAIEKRLNEEIIIHPNVFN